MNHIKKFFEFYNVDDIITNEVPLKSLPLISKSKLDKNDPIILAKKIFGVTEEFSECGYITVYGDMLDFSGKRNGCMPYIRNDDHRDINKIGISMIDFMEIGNIRFKPECNGLEITQPLTKYQKITLNRFIEYYNTGEIYIDLNFGKVDKYSTYIIYPTNTRSSKIFNDIDRYYQEGIKPIIKDH